MTGMAFYDQRGLLGSNVILDALSGSSCTDRSDPVNGQNNGTGGSNSSTAQSPDTQDPPPTTRLPPGGKNSYDHRLKFAAK